MILRQLNGYYVAESDDLDPLDFARWLSVLRKFTLAFMMWGNKKLQYSSFSSFMSPSQPETVSQVYKTHISRYLFCSVPLKRPWLRPQSVRDDFGNTRVLVISSLPNPNERGGRGK